MKKIMIFPYHPDIEVLEQHKNALVDYRILGVVSYREDNNRIQSINAKFNKDILSYEQLIDACDAVVILDNYRNYKTDKYYQIIQDSLDRHKEVLITPYAKTQLMLDDYKGRYNLLENTLPIFSSPDSVSAEMLTPRKYNIKASIIAVLGQGMHCEKFQYQLITKSILDKNYKVECISSNALGTLFGCHTIPSFFYNEYSFMTKIILYNHYIANLERLNHPDIILVGIPEGITPFSKIEYHHFSEYPLIISKAVSIYMGLFCRYFISGQIQNYGIQNTVDYCMNKFGIPVVATAISKTLYEVPIEDTEKIIYEFLNFSDVDEFPINTTEVKLPIITPQQRKNAKIIIEDCLQILKNNVKGL